ncbi:RNI-like protein [Hygrophoropsis aurantiaca]|uniref:RNI-like protein n=1 Tax=Hygrophoropsis aurantiaca TaxID=72124 RepID=A0ACB8AQ07_9AGAM|nr:RNI-like protein [Hygrophoropsis aurantiaca]
MSKRSKVTPATKRQRTTAIPTFGAATDDDLINLVSSQRNAPSASVLSHRTLPITDSMPSLTVLCARVFVSNIRILARNRDDWEHTRSWLKLLPDSIITRVFAMLRSSCPTILGHAFITAYFFRGSSITLTSELLGVERTTISAIAKVDSLRELHLIGFEKFADTVYAAVLPSLPSLHVLVLRGCAKVGPKTVEAAAKSCPLLTTVNLSYTAVPPISLAPLLAACPQLQVLKVAGISTWTDTTFSKLLFSIGPDLKLEHMHTLKFRQNALSEASIYPFLSLCLNVRRLDISFTLVHRSLSSTTLPLINLEKLSLTSTMVSSVDIVALMPHLSNLKKLSIGALGGGQGSAVSIGNTSAMTMSDQTLQALTDILESFERLEDVNLVGNTKLGITSRGNGALSDFFRRVGRRCISLNLSGVQYLRSQDLAGLFTDTTQQSPPKLETLILNNTGVDDEAAPFLSCCSFLTTLELAGTKITDEGLFPIIDACPRLSKLDLTSCRGINVVDRRRFFEVWEENKRQND